SVKSDTPAIRQQVIPVDDNTHREKLTRWLLLNECEVKAIVFTNTRVMADRLNGVLRAVEGLRVYVLHGEKDQKERKLAIERFKQGGKGVLVATDVAARGLDISKLDLVINFDMPRSGDDYLHRVGRTGRAGAEGLAVSLVAPHEWSLMSSIERYLRRQFERREIKGLRSEGVLVATDVAARGLDISELDLVINFDMPRSGDDYLHRVGRTGRAGAEGLAVSLVAPHEWSLMSSIERYLRRQFERREIKEL